MVKLVLSEEPSLSWNKCPFMDDMEKCVKTCSECQCIGGYSDYMLFDFDKCPYCTTLDKALKNCIKT